MASLTAVSEIVQRHDPDRFLTALFAPSRRRDKLLLLYALNHELARAREVAREPAMALIRLQWWREVIAGEHRRHEVAEPLSEALEKGELRREDLEAMIEGRELEAERDIVTLGDWHRYVSGTAGALAVAAGHVLGADTVMLERLSWLGTAYGIAGQIRSVPALARQGRCLLPRHVLRGHGLTAEGVIAKPDDPRLRPVLTLLAGEGRRLLREARGRLPRRMIAAALPAVLARRDLRHPEAPPRPRRLSDKIAVCWAYRAGRV